MGKNSKKQLVEQLMQWLPTLSSKRKKPIKPNVIGKHQAYKQR